MSHSHEHSHGQGSDKQAVLGWAIVTFGCLGLVQLVVALLAGRVALLVDALHNLGEAPVLGVSLAALRLKNRALGRLWTCRILPLAPALSAGLTVVISGVLLVLMRSSITAGGIWLAFVLELISFAANVAFHRKLEGGKDDSDANIAVAIAHLLGDSVASGVALLAYLAIGLCRGSPILDPIAAWIGLAVIASVHVAPIARSLSDFARHQQHGHDCPGSS